MDKFEFELLTTDFPGKHTTIFRGKATAVHSGEVWISWVSPVVTGLTQICVKPCTFQQDSDGTIWLKKLTEV